MDRDPHLYHNDQYEDITADMKAFTSQMKVGELVHVPNFSLFGSINAFEMGNARMDTGKKYRPLAKDIETIPPVNSSQDFCDLADIVVAAEMAWHQGNMPLRTFLCCLPLEKIATELTSLAPDNFRMITTESSKILDYLGSKLPVNSWDHVADIYLLATLKVSAMTMALIETEPTIVPPDEDFHLAHGNYYMLDNTPIDIVTRLVDAAMRFAKSDPAATARLQLKASWLQVVKQRFAKKATHVDKVLEALDIYKEADFERQNPFAVVMSDGVQSRAEEFSLAQSLVILSLKTAVEQWKSMARGLKDLSRVMAVTKSADLLGFFLVFSSQGHLPLVRVSLKTIITSGDILGQNVRTWITKDMRELSWPDYDPAKNRGLFEPYITQASQAYLDLITTFLLNRGLQRENLVALVQQFDSLQVTADQIDSTSANLGIGRKLRTGQGTEIWAMELSSAVQLRKLQVMLWVVLWTLELEIALPWEYGYVYWYAAQLGQRLLDQLARLKAYFEQNSMRSSEDGYAYLVALELEARGLTQVCSAQYLIHVALQKRGLVSQPRSPLTSLQLQYGLRFQMFESVGVPPMARLDEYQAIYDKLDANLALEAARNSITGARSLLKTLMRVTQENEEMQLISRSCVGLQLAISSIQKAKTGRLEYEKDGYHRYFPVVKVVPN